jgi:hypothetical protein
MSHSEVVYITVIAGRKIQQELVNSLAESGCTMFNAVYGNGFVKSNDFLTAFGFVNDAGKIVVTALANSVNVDKIFAMLNTKFNFNKPNTGIAFTVPVESLTF